MEAGKKTKIRPTREEYLTPGRGIINYFSRTSQDMELRQGSIRAEADRFNGFLKLALVQGSELYLAVYTLSKLI